MEQEKDIVGQLRDQGREDWSFLGEEAANEIERLRAKIVALEYASGLTRMGQERGSDNATINQVIERQKEGKPW